MFRLKARLALSSARSSDHERGLLNGVAARSVEFAGAAPVFTLSVPGILAKESWELVMWNTPKI
jgi:hypothetical protein